MEALREDVSRFSGRVRAVCEERGAGVAEAQVVLHRVAESAALLYSQAAVLSRASSVAEEDGPSEAALARAWCGVARPRLLRLLEELEEGSAREADRAVLEIGRASLLAGGYCCRSPVGVL